MTITQKLGRVEKKLIYCTLNLYGQFYYIKVDCDQLKIHAISHKTATKTCKAKSYHQCVNKIKLNHRNFSINTNDSRKEHAKK